MQLTTVSLPGKEVIVRSERERIVRSVFEMANGFKNYYIVNSFNEGITIEVTRNSLYETWKNNSIINLSFIENRNTVRLIMHIKKAATLGLKQRDFYELQNELETFYLNLLGYIQREKYEAQKPIKVHPRKNRFNRRKVAVAFFIYFLVMIYLFYVVIKNVLLD